MRLTIAEYLTAGGVSINEKGIEPHYVVELPEPATPEEARARRLSTTYFSLEDPQIQKALEVMQDILSGSLSQAA